MPLIATPGRLVRVIAWLLTPVVAWAASFLGGWIGAMIGQGAKRVEGGLVWLGTGALIGGAVGVVGWVVMLRRWSPKGDVSGGGSDEMSNVQPQNHQVRRREQ